MINSNLKLKDKEPLSKQTGYALLITSLIILLGIVITALITSKAVSSDQIMVSDNYRGEQAFQAAEAGLEYGMVYLNANKTAILVNDPNNNGYILPYSNAQVTNVAFSNNTTFSITYTNPVQSSYTRVKIVSIGKADNANATRTVSQQMQVSPFIVNPPPVPLVAQGAVNLSGNINIQNTSGSTTIWSGSSTTLTGSAITSTASGTSSTSTLTGPDISQNDSNIGGMSNTSFFNGFFGTSSSSAQSNADITYTNSADTNYSGLLDGVTGKSIWINQTGGTAQFSGSATIGSTTNPVVIVMNGNLQANGTTTIYGVVYVTGDWNNSGGGTLNVIGAVVVQGAMNSTGTPNVTYSPSVLTNLGQVGTFVKVPGTWLDF